MAFFGGKSLLEASLLARRFRSQLVSETCSSARTFVGDSCLGEKDLFGKKGAEAHDWSRGCGNRNEVVFTLLELKMRF